VSLRRTQALLGCMLMLMFDASAHAAPPTPRALIMETSSRLAKLAKRAENHEVLRAGVTEVVSEIVDFQAFSARTMKARWTTFTEPQRLRFEGAFRGLVLSIYAKRFKPGMDFKVAFRGPTLRPDASHATVRTTLEGPKASVDVDYHLHFIKVDEVSRWRVIDFIIDEVSMVRNWGRSFSEALVRDGYEVLVTKIEEKSRRR
jgi:phospholipid transport system substrate-binding protein